VAHNKERLKVLLESQGLLLQRAMEALAMDEVVKRLDQLLRSGGLQRQQWYLDKASLVGGKRVPVVLGAAAVVVVVVVIYVVIVVAISILVV